MDSIVLELQRDALDSQVRVSDLLRKALVVSRKLSLQDFQGWISRELNGYGTADEIPDYRKLYGEVRGLNPYRGWMPVLFKDDDQADFLAKRSCTQSVAALEHLCATETSELQMEFPPGVQRILGAHVAFQVQLSLFIQQTDLIHILDAVRTVVLDWALRLEKEGVLGEGLTFTHEEKRAAESIQSVSNYYGTTQIQQGSPNAIQVASTVPDPAGILSFLEEFRGTLDQLNLPAERRLEAEAEILTLDAQLASPIPKPTILRESLRSVRSILEQTTATVAAQLLTKLTGLGL